MDWNTDAGGDGNLKLDTSREFSTKTLDAAPKQINDVFRMYSHDSYPIVFHVWYI